MAPPDTEVTVGRRLIRLGSRLHRLQVERLEALSTPLSIRQYRILDRVDQGITSLGRLAELARRQPSTVSKSADSLVRQGLLQASWGTSDNNRRAKFYELTATGRNRLREETEGWTRLADAMTAVLTAREEEV